SLDNRFVGRPGWVGPPSRRGVSRQLHLCECSVNWFARGRAAAKIAGRRRRSQMERQQDYVLRTVEERGIRFVLLWFTDVLGQLKSVAITPAELENAFAEGMSFDGSAV